MTSISYPDINRLIELGEELTDSTEYGTTLILVTDRSGFQLDVAVFDKNHVIVKNGKYPNQSIDELASMIGSYLPEDSEIRQYLPQVGLAP